MSKAKRGRPHKPEGVLSPPISVRFAPAELTKLDEIVADRRVANPGVSRADIVREIVHQMLSARVA